MSKEAVETSARKVDAVAAATEQALELEELQSVKEEMLDQQSIENAAGELTVFPIEAVASGIVEIESSSGSDSDSSSSSDDSSSSGTVVQAQGPHVVEDVPEGVEYYKHAKSGLVHSCKLGESFTKCRTQVGSNLRKLKRRIFVVHPKDNNRIRSCDQLVARLDTALRQTRARTSEVSQPSA